jgi:ribosomal protein S27E
MYAKKVEYLKGLMAGLSLGPDTNEFKLFTAVIDALDAFSGALGDVEEDMADLEDALDGMNDELDAIGDLMDAVSDFDGEESNITPFPGMAHNDDDEEDSEYEVTCPGCGHTFIVDEDTIFDGNVACPSCSEKLAFDISGGCGCGGCRIEDPNDD